MFLLAPYWQLHLLYRAAMTFLGAAKALRKLKVKVRNRKLQYLKIVINLIKNYWFVKDSTSNERDGSHYVPVPSVK